MLETITKQSNPAQWALIKQALPNYRKRKAFVSSSDSVELGGRYWSDGSRNDWIIIHPTGPEAVGSRNDFPFTAPEKVIALDSVIGVVCSGYFCGKPSTAHLYLKPASD